MKKVLIWLIALVCFNAKAADDDMDNITTRILKASTVYIANLKKFRSNVNHGIQSIEFAYEAWYSLGKPFLTLPLEHNPYVHSLLLNAQNTMRQVEEAIKLIPTIQNIVTGSLITDSIEIGHSPINFAYLGLDALNNFGKPEC